MEYSEKIRQKVADMIASGDHSIPEVCDKIGITQGEFIDWVANIEEFATTVKVATEVKYDNRLSLAWRAQRKLIEGWSYDEVTEEVEFIHGKNESDPIIERVVKRKIVTKKIGPSASATLHALKALDPRLNPTERYDHTSGGEPIGAAAPNIFLNIPATAKSLKAADSN